MKFKPHAYQKRAISHILDHPEAGLFLGMGLGKTVIALTAAEQLIYDSCEVGKVLVIAPLRVAEDTWSRESSKWGHLNHLRISKILGTAAKRKAALQADADVYIINRENVEWLCGLYQGPWPFDMVIIDELSSFKSPKAKRFRALRKKRPYVKRIVGLTGTPVGNSLMDLWAEVYLLDRGERLGASYTAYQRRYFKPAYGQGYVVYKWTTLPGALEEITRKISDIALTMKAEDYLQLPDMIESRIEVELKPKELKAYKAMEQEAVAELNGEEVAAFSATAVMIKLLQLANGFCYTEEKKALRFLHQAKLDALKEIVEFADGPVLVFYQFQADKDLILSEIPGAQVLSGADSIAAWNRGDASVMLAHPASAGYGLNLQEGGHIMVWYGLPWSLEQYQQAVARLHRQGQEKPVTIYHLIAKGTVDEKVAASLESKDMTQEALLKILKEV